MCGEVATIAQLLDAVANPRHEVCEAAPMILQAPSTDVIRIRKYPNRRLYDTSRSTHLTHDEVLAIVRRGLRVQISDSRTETDITNEVLPAGAPPWHQDSPPWLNTFIIPSRRGSRC
jgi:hypothetical protein